LPIYHINLANSPELQHLPLPSFYTPRKTIAFVFDVHGKKKTEIIENL
jgi:hypothetical protein